MLRTRNFKLKGTPLRYGRMSQKKVKCHEPIFFCYLRVRDIQTESVIHRYVFFGLASRLKYIFSPILWEKRLNTFQFANLNKNNGHVMILRMTKKRNGEFFVYRQQRKCESGIYQQSINLKANYGFVC
jgi:hypothetical protein